MTASAETILTFAEETTPGTAATGAYQELAWSSIGLNAAPVYIQSNLVKRGRIRPDSIKVGDTIEGDIASEFAAENFDAFMEGLFCNRWDTVTDVTYDLLTVGEEDITFTIEQEFLYLTAPNPDRIIQYTGCQIATGNFGISADDIITFTLNFQGRGVQFLGTTAAASVAPVGSNSSLSTCADFLDLKIGGVNINSGFPELSFEISNNLRALKSIGVCGTARHAKGVVDATGSLTAFHDAESHLLYKESLNNSSNSIEWTMNGGAKTYVLEIPKYKSETTGPQPGGQDDDNTVVMNFNAVDQSPILKRTK